MKVVTMAGCIKHLVIMTNQISKPMMIRCGEPDTRYDSSKINKSWPYSQLLYWRVQWFSHGIVSYDDFDSSMERPAKNVVREIHQYGAECEWYWNNTKFKQKVCRAEQITWVKYPSDRFSLLGFNQSSGHTAMASGIMDEWMSEMVVHLSSSFSTPAIPNTRLHFAYIYSFHLYTFF